MDNEICGGCLLKNICRSDGGNAENVGDCSWKDLKKQVLWVLIIPMLLIALSLFVLIAAFGMSEIAAFAVTVVIAAVYYIVVKLKLSK